MNPLSINFARNTFAFNTKVRIELGDQIQTQELTLTRGYLSSSESVLHFGTGNVEKVDRAIITWPDGQETILTDLATNKVHKVFSIAPTFYKSP